MARKSSGGPKNGGGESAGPVNLVGTSNDDRLRGTAYDDTFEGRSGDDLIQGGDGVDTAIYEGSVFDYSWTTSKRGWQVKDWGHWSRENNGTDDLQNIEILKFDDATIILGEAQPTIFEGPGLIEVTVGEEVDFSFRIYDFDNRFSEGFISSEPDVGRISYQRDTNYGMMNKDATFNMTFLTDGSYNSRDLAYLAEGETLTVTYTIEVSDDFGDITDLFSFDISILGVNEAPLLEGTASLEITEGDPASSVDLAQFASDVDSDDDANTLRYEIVSVSDGFEVTLDATILSFDPTQINPAMTSDEFLEGEVVIRAVDRHGAVSDVITLNLTMRGIDGPATPTYVFSGGVDYDALGIDPEAVPGLGYLDPTVIAAQPELAALLAFTDGDDVRVIAANQVAWFDLGGVIRDDAGNVVAPESGFLTGAGNDMLVFDVDGPENALITNVEVDTGSGEDVLAMSAITDAAQAVITADIETGMNSDQVWLETRGSAQMWITGYINTGSGHDTVFARMDTSDASTPTDAFFDAGVNLGSGDDVFDLEMGEMNAVFRGNIDISLFAGDGNDHVSLSNAAVRQTIVDGLNYEGSWASLFYFGMEGAVSMGSGDDLLDLNLNDAFQAGTTAFVDGGDGQDVLILNHIVAGEAIFEDLGGGSLRITDGNQVLNVSGFEEILLGDGSDAFLFL